MMLRKEYVLMDEDGTILDFVFSNRPSGPILSNFQWHAGKRWVPAEAVPQDWIEDYFSRQKV